MKITKKELRQIIKEELSLVTESDLHMKKDGNTYYVDTNFVNFSKLLPNSKLSHLGMGDFKLETKFGDVEFSRVNKKFKNFVGRSHKVNGDKSTIQKIVKELDSISSTSVIEETALISEAMINLDYRNIGTVNFKIVESDATLVLIPSKTDDLDKIKQIKDTLNNEDFFSLTINRLYDKTKIKFKEDKKYRGSGYGFIPDYKFHLR